VQVGGGMPPVGGGTALGRVFVFVLGHALWR
jgi:hypothetical protein